MSLYFFVAILFIPIGSSIIAGSARVGRTERIFYSDIPECDIGDESSVDEVKNCVVSFSIPKKLTAPAFVYYGLTEFHQNARSYARSRSDRQLRGLAPRTMLDVSNCEPLLYDDDVPNSERGQFDVDLFKNPCGIAANTVFNDSFTLCRDELCDTEVPLRENGIAWSTDRQKKFQPGDPPLFSPETNTLLQDEDFMVWMRLSAYSNFEKLYRIVDEDLEPGTYYMSIESRFPVSSFSGRKLFLVSNMTWFGDQNYVLGALFLVAGVLAMVIATGLLANFMLRARPPIDQDPARITRQIAKLHADSPEFPKPTRR